MKKKIYHHGNLEKELLKTAKDIFVNENLEAITIRRLAKEVKVSPTAFYHHFADIDELINKLAEIYLCDLENVSTQAISVEPDHIQRLYKLGEVYIFYAIENPRNFSLMFRPKSGLSDHTNWSNRVLLRTLIHVVTDILPKNTSQEKIQLTAISAWSLVHGMAVLLANGPLSDLNKDQVSTRKLVHQVVRSIKLD